MCLLLFIPAGETTAQNTTLVSNTGETANAEFVAPVGTKFTTGTNSTGYTISSVNISFAGVNSGINRTVTIRANGTNPDGTVIATLSPPASLTANAVNTFTAPANTVLNANTTYWLRVNSTGDSRPRATSSDAESGATGWSIGNTSSWLPRASWVSTTNVLVFAINGQVNPPPPASTGLTATAGDRQVTLSWSDPSNSTISKYQYRQGSGSPLIWESWTDITNSDASTTTHTVTGLTNGTEYSFQVRAMAGTLNGTASATVTATPLAPPVVTIARQGSAAVTEGMDVVFRVTASRTVTTDLKVNLSVAEAAGSDFIASNNKGMKMVMIPASSGSVTYTVATEDDNMDESNGSVTVTVRDGTGYTVGSPSEASVMVNDNDVPLPAKPAGFTAAAGDEEVTLSWTDPKNSDITGYQFRQKAGSNSYGPWTDISNSAAAVTHTITGLTNGTAYTFQVRAVAGTVNGAPSDEKIATPRANSAPTVMTMIPDQTAIVGVTFRYQFSEDTFSDADGDPLTYAATRGDDSALPDWLDFDKATRTFSGTPQAGDAGTLNIRVTASDDNGRSVFDAFDITVNAQPLVTITRGTSPVTEGTAAAFTVTAAPAPASNLDVNLSVAEAAGSDFIASGNEGMKTVMIPASGSATYTVATVSDDTDEPDGSVMVIVENGTGYAVGTPSEATVTVNDDDEEETLLGAEDTEEAVIFPNPSGRYLEVRSPVGSAFKILSLSGKSLLEGTTNTKVDITSLRSGLYLVQLPDGRLLKFIRE